MRPFDRFFQLNSRIDRRTNHFFFGTQVAMTHDAWLFDCFERFGNQHTIIVFFELTCPWDDNILRSHEFKDRKYAPLIADLSRHFNLKFKVHNYSVEISVRGQVSKQNRARLKSFLFNCSTLPGNSFKRLIRICSKAALLSSYSIFGARKEPSWMSPNPLVVRDWLHYLPSLGYFYAFEFYPAIVYSFYLIRRYINNDLVLTPEYHFGTQVIY